MPSTPSRNALRSCPARMRRPRPRNPLLRRCKTAMAMTLHADDALIVVDIQYDFLPGGSLAVAGGDEIIEPVNALARRFRNVVMTQDWHPKGHISFASSHEGLQPFQTIELPYGRQVLWPDHCVIGTRGAQFSTSLDIPHVQAVIRKGY